MVVAQVDTAHPFPMLRCDRVLLALLLRPCSQVVLCNSVYLNAVPSRSQAQALESIKAVGGR